jgi:hypothetical protein
MFVPSIWTSKAEVSTIPVETRTCSFTLVRRLSGVSSSIRFQVLICPFETSNYHQPCPCTAGVGGSYLKYPRPTFITPVATVSAIPYSPTITHPSLLIPILVHLIQHTIIIRMIMSRSKNHDILLRQRISEPTIIDWRSRRFQPISNNGISHGAIFC